MRYIRKELSKRNEDHLDYDRTCELVYFVKQMPRFKSRYYSNPIVMGRGIVEQRYSMDPSDPTGDIGTDMAILYRNMRMIEESAYEASPEYGKYILEAVVNGFKYETIDARLRADDIFICSRNEFYRLRSKFLAILDKKRQ